MARPSDGNGSEFIDVRRMLHQASSRVRVDQLLRQGTKYVSLLSKERVEELVNQAVRNILEKHHALGGNGVADGQIRVESTREFKELLDDYGNAARARRELEASKEAMNAELAELQQDLEREGALSEAALAEERAAAFRQFEAELGRVVDETFARRKALLDGSPQALAELEKVEALLREIIFRLVDGERERFARSGGRDREIAVLRRRIEKLLGHIATLEGALRGISQSKVYSNQQIQNLLRTLGLLSDDKYFEKKKEMLKLVLDHNRDLRRRFVEIEQQGISLANPQGMN